MMISEKPSSRKPPREEVDPHANSGTPTHNVTSVEAALSSIPFLPGFDIMCELGSGGMGVVYKAWQFSLKRLVALKMIRSGRAASPREIERFRIEAMAVARLKHANLVQIHEIGDHAGMPYFVMEFMDGSTLARRLDGRPVDPSIAAQIVEKLARAMHHAHQQNIVHRDLKPANILLSGDLGGRLEDCVPKITDFGLVKHLNQDNGQTMQGDVLGTPGYMAPEQAMGQIDRIGPATDIYSLGSILYELLTGQIPLQGGSQQETLHLIATRDPVSPRRLRRTVPADLETICMKCLEREPGRRYGGADELADDLHRWLQGEPIKARPVSLLERCVKWAKRSPAVAFLSGALLLLLVASFTLVTVFWQRAEEEARKQAKARQNTEHLLSGSYLERGINLAEQGSVGAGMLWMVRGLEIANRNSTADPRAVDMESVIRRNLAGWSHQVFRRSVKLQHEHWLRSVRFSHDGKHVFTSSTDGAIAVWDSFSGAEKARFHNRFSVFDINLSPDGKYVVAACSDFDLRKRTVSTLGEVCVWAIEAGDQDAVVGRQLKAPVPVTEPCSRATFSPDGKKLAVIGYEKAYLFEWPPQEGQPCKEIGAPLKHPTPPARNGVEVDRSISSIAFSPDSSMLVSTSQDHTACCWDTATGELIGEPLQHDGVVEEVKFTHDGRYFLTAAGVMPPGEKSANAGKARLWNAATRKVAAVMHHPGKVRSLAISADDKLIATSSYVFDRERRVVKSAEVRLWQGPTPNSAVRMGWEVMPAIAQPNNVWAMEFSRDGRYLFTGCEDGQARMFCTASGHRVGPTFTHFGNVMTLALSPTENRVVSGGSGGGSFALLWDFPPSQVHGVLYHSHPVTNVQWHPDGRSILCRTWDGVGRFWDLDTLLPREPLPLYLGIFTLSADGGKIIASKQPRPGHDYPDKLHWIDSTSGAVEGKTVTNLHNPYQVIVAPDQRRIVVRMPTDRLHVKDSQTDEYVFPPLKHDFHVTAACCSSDGRFIVTSYDDANQARAGIVVIDADTGKVVRTWSAHNHLAQMALSPDDRHIVTSGDDRQITFWDLETGKSAGAPLLQPHFVRSMSFSKDGKLLVTGTNLPAARVWDVSARKQIGPPLMSTLNANRVAFHPNGKLVLVGDDSSRSVVIWKVPEAIGGSFEEVKMWVEYLSGMAPNENDTETVLGTDELLQRRAQLKLSR